MPLAHLGKYHAQYNFAGRLGAPIEIVDAPQLKHWVAAHPAGQVIVIVRMKHVGLDGKPGAAPEYQAPFRGAWMQVWRGATLLVTRPELR